MKHLFKKPEPQVSFLAPYFCNFSIFRISCSLYSC